MAVATVADITEVLELMLEAVAVVAVDWAQARERCLFFVVDRRLESGFNRLYQVESGSHMTLSDLVSSTIFHVFRVLSLWWA